MLKKVAQVYNDAILTQAIEHYGLTKDQLTLIDSNTDVVHEYARADKTYILKLIHSSQATRELVCGEVDWVHHLADYGAPVSRPVLSGEGNLVEVVAAGSSYFTVVAYEKAPGGHVGYEQDEWNAELFQTCGRVVGQMHALAKTYTPSDPAYKRPNWRELVRKERYPPGLDAVYAKRQQLMEHVQTLPKGRDAYGLIHGDFHSYNFSVYDAGITVFDLSECNYAHFAYEIAIVLYHVLDLPYLGQDHDRFGRFFMEHFMPAYNRENRLDPYWETEMDNFLRLREISIYSYIHVNWDYETDQAVQDWMEACLYRIMNDQPIANIDWNFG